MPTSTSSFPSFPTSLSYFSIVKNFVVLSFLCFLFMLFGFVVIVVVFITRPINQLSSNVCVPNLSLFFTHRSLLSYNKLIITFFFLYFAHNFWVIVSVVVVDGCISLFFMPLQFERVALPPTETLSHFLRQQLVRETKTVFEWMSMSLYVCVIFLFYLFEIVCIFHFICICV